MRYLIFLLLLTSFTSFAQTSIDSFTGSINCDTNRVNNKGRVLDLMLDVSNAPTTGTMTALFCDGTEVVVANAPFPNSIPIRVEDLSQNNSDCVTIFKFSDSPYPGVTIRLNTLECNSYVSRVGLSVGTCDPLTNTFNTNGFFVVNRVHSQEVFTVRNCSGETLTFNPPFADTVRFSFPNQTSNGLDCFVIVSGLKLTDTITVNYTNRPTCIIPCEANAGTVRVSIIGSSNSIAPGPYDLCYDDIIKIESNNDTINVPRLLNNSQVYEPGIGLARFDCPPTASYPNNLLVDPCLSSPSLYGLIDGVQMHRNTNTSNSTHYLAPLTLYNKLTNVYAIIQNGIPSCYDLSSPIQINYLTRIVASTITDCSTGQLLVKLSGSKPSLVSSERFTIVPGSLTPSTATIVTNSALNNEQVVIGGLLDGQAYSFIVKDGVGCGVLVSGTFSGAKYSAIDYGQNELCKSGSPLTPIITGIVGGVFSSTAGLSINSTTGEITPNTSTPGLYTITYTPAGGVCVPPTTTEITLLSNPTISAGSNLSVCSGNSTLLTASGGVDYSWDNGLGTGDSHRVQPTTTTTYSVTGIDGNGCENNATVTINVSPLPGLSVDGTDFCQGEEYHSNLIYTGTPNVNNPFVSSNPSIISVSPNGDFTANSGGNATITYTDDKGCKSTVDLSVFNTNFQITPDKIICEGESVTLEASGGLTYSWNNGLSSASSIMITPTVSTDYSCLIVDQNGCSRTETTHVNIAQRSNADVTLSSDTQPCASENPSINIVGQGGISPYTFTYTVNGGAVQTIVSTGDSAIINLLPTIPGDFTILITHVSESNLCPKEVSESVTVTVSQPLLGTLSGATTVCQNSTNPSINIIGQGGTSPYMFTYRLNGGAPQTIVSAGNTATLNVPTTNSGVFNYELVGISDANGCNKSITETTRVTVKAQPTASISGTTTICQNGVNPIITLTGANGAAPYTFTYKLNGAAAQTIVSTGNTATISSPTNIVGVFTYELIGVSDANGCEEIHSETAIVTVNPGATASISGTTSICKNGPIQSVVLTGADGIAPYTFTYKLNGGATQTIVSTGNTATISSPTDIIGVNSYELTSVSDVNGCGQTTFQIAVVTVNDQPTASISGTTAICNNGARPNITFTGANGNAPYTFTYKLNGGTPLTIVSTGNNATINAPTDVLGTFNYELISVSDDKGCGQSQSGAALITVNPGVTASISGSTSVCLDETSPTITLTGTTGIAPYTFTYNLNGGPTKTVVSTGNSAVITVPTNIAQTYTYTLLNVSDVNSCGLELSDDATVVVNALPTVNAGLDASICEDESYLLNATGTATSYTWNVGLNNGESYIITNTSTLTVTGTDANGCSAQDNILLTALTPIAVNAGSDLSICEGETVLLKGQMQDGSVGTYVWNNGVVDGVAFSPTTSTTYSVVSTDVNGCTSTDELIVTLKLKPIVSAGQDKVICNGEQIILSGSGIDNGIYTWNNGVVNNVGFVPNAGLTTFILTGTAANGCSNKDTITVNVLTVPEISFTVNQKGFCVPAEVELKNTTQTTGMNCVWTIPGLAPIVGCEDKTVFMNKPGSYNVSLTVSSPNGECFETKTLTNSIQIDKTPIASFSFSPDEITVVNNLVTFQNHSTNAVNYQWDFGNGKFSTEKNPVEVLSYEANAYNVILVASSLKGCSDTMRTVIKVEEEFLFFAPNAFTPNGSSRNEIFNPVFVAGYDPYDYSIHIYNRWGEMVFESHDATIGWDGYYGGTICPDGMYIWKIVVRTHETKNDERKVFTGNVTLLR